MACKFCSKVAWSDGWAGLHFLVEECHECGEPVCQDCAEYDYDMVGDPPSYVCCQWDCPNCVKEKREKRRARNVNVQV